MTVRAQNKSSNADEKQIMKYFVLRQISDQRQIIGLLWEANHPHKNSENETKITATETKIILGENKNNYQLKFIFDEANFLASITYFGPWIPPQSKDTKPR